jgi:hypothetical protein
MIATQLNANKRSWMKSRSTLGIYMVPPPVDMKQQSKGKETKLMARLSKWLYSIQK